MNKKIAEIVQKFLSKSGRINPQNHFMYIILHLPYMPFIYTYFQKKIRM